jgi:uncharacterized integral membrane protein
MRSSAKSPTPSDGPRRSRKAAKQGPTRIRWAWGTVIVCVILGVALVDFLAQNTRSVSIEFFSVSGHVPIVVALLVAALIGAAVVLIVGVARMDQMRRFLRSGGKDRQAAQGPAGGPEGDTTTPTAR